MYNFEMFNANGERISLGEGSIIDARIDYTKEKEREDFVKTLSHGHTITLENPKVNYHMLYQMMGFKIIEDKYMVDKFRNKIHSKKRIDKKYLKKFGFYEIPKKNVFKVGNTIIGHPATIAALNECQ